jgi:hypothetical protein
MGKIDLPIWNFLPKPLEICDFTENSAHCLDKKDSNYKAYRNLSWFIFISRHFSGLDDIRIRMFFLYIVFGYLVKTPEYPG